MIEILRINYLEVFMKNKLYILLFTLVSFVSIASFASQTKRSAARNSLSIVVPGQADCKQSMKIDGVPVHFHTSSAKSKFLVHLEAAAKQKAEKKQKATKRKHSVVYDEDEIFGQDDLVEIQESEDNDDEYKWEDTLAGRAQSLRKEKLAAEQEYNKKQRIDSHVQPAVDQTLIASSVAASSSFSVILTNDQKEELLKGFSKPRFSLSPDQDSADMVRPKAVRPSSALPRLYQMPKGSFATTASISDNSVKPNDAE